MTQDEDYYTIGEVAQKLKVKERTIYRYIKTGYLHGERINPKGALRIHKTELERALKHSSPTK